MRQRHFLPLSRHNQIHGLRPDNAQTHEVIAHIHSNYVIGIGHGFALGVLAVPANAGCARNPKILPAKHAKGTRKLNDFPELDL